MKGEEQMNGNRVRLRLIETEAYCRELRMAYIAAGAVIFVCYLMSFAQYMAI